MQLFCDLNQMLRTAAIVCSVGAFWAGAAAAQEIRAATEVGSGGDLAILLAEFETEVEARSDDLEVNVFTGGSVGTQRQLQEQLQLGTIEVVATASDIVELAGEFSIFDLPFLFRDTDHARRVIDGELGTQLNETLIESRGVRVLAFGELGFRHITNNVRPIETPEDLVGLKLRTPSNEMRIAAFKALGASPTPIPYSELYSALQQGVVDGQENPVGTIEEQSLFEVQDYLSLTNHVYTPAYIIVNEDWWQGLSDEERKVLSEAAKAAAETQRSIIASGTQEIIAAVENEGMQVNSPDTTPFAEATKPLWQSFEDEHGAALIEAVESER